MERNKNVIRLSSSDASGTVFQSLSSIPVSTKIRSVLEVVGKNHHLCSLSENSTYLSVLELHPNALVRDATQKTAEQKKIAQPAEKSNCSSFSQLSSDRKQKTETFVLNLKTGRYKCLGSIDGLCTVAVFHYHVPLLAVLQPPCRVHIFHVELGGCCEVIEFSNVAGPLLGLQWLPRVPLPSGASSDGESPAGGGAVNEISAPATSGLLSFSSCDLVTFRSHAPCERLPVQPSVCWAGAVLGGESVALVREDGSVELLSLSGGPTSSLPPLPGLSSHLPVVCVSLMPCGEILLVVLRERRVVRCDVRERTTSLVSLDTPAPPAALRSAVVLNTRRSDHPQVLLVLDTAGAVHVLSAKCWSCLRTLQPPSLTVESMSASSDGGLLCLTYSNNTSKLYRLCSLLSQLDGTVKPKLPAGKENRRIETMPQKPDKTGDSTDAGSKKSAADVPHRVRFSEVAENGPTSSVGTSKSLLKKVKAAASHPDWRKLLEEFGSFPSNERAAIWSGLLRLPRCATIHHNLASKVLHSAVPLYSSMADQSLRDTFRRTLSCLYYWAPQLAVVPWVPSFVFPFVKSLQHAPLICFELCVALLVSWCRLWFSAAPDVLVPPVLNTVEVLVCDSSPRLMAALVRAHVTALTYAWPLLSTAFAQVLSAEDWVVAWDHLLCRPPSFLLCFTAAYTLCLAPAIRAAAADQPRHIESLYSQESYLPVRSVLRKATELHASMKLDAELLSKIDAVTPFPEGGLPVFHNIPYVQAIKPDPVGGVDGALQTLGWSLDESEFEQERAALREREERCIATMRRVRRQHLSSA